MPQWYCPCDLSPTPKFAISISADLLVIGFNQSTYTISEGEGSVELCLASDVALPEAVQAVITSSEIQDSDSNRGMAHGIALWVERMICFFMWYLPICQEKKVSSWAQVIYFVSNIR